MITKKNITTFVALLIVLSVFTALPVYSLDVQETDHVLVRDPTPDHVDLIYSAGGRIAEDYDNFILVELPRSGLDRLHNSGICYEPMADRTNLYLGDLVFDVKEGEPDMPDELTIHGYRDGVVGTYLVHTIGPIANGWLDELEDRGVDVIHYIPTYSFKVRMTPEMARGVHDLYFIEWVGLYHPYYKIQGEVEPGIVEVGMIPSACPGVLDYIGEEYHILSRTKIDDSFHMLTLEVNSIEEINELAYITDVDHIANHVEPELEDEMATQIIGGGLWFFDDEDNDPTTAYRLHGNYGSYMNQLGYTGDGVVVTVADTGLGDGTTPNAGHQDFTGRVIGGYVFGSGGWADDGTHGTHCAGSVAGDTHNGRGVEYYNDYYAAQGSAPGAQLYPIRVFGSGAGFPSDLFDLVETAKQNAGAYVHSNSWGAATGGTYGSRESRFDAAVRDADRDTPGNQPMVITKSAGNDGPGHTTVSSPGNAKNIITIGATLNYNPNQNVYNPDDVASFSSRGWSADNRIKPDVVAPGSRIYSTDPGGGYRIMSGTSMANPAVAGAAAVVVEWYEVNHGTRPTPAMVKALLINTANDLDDNSGNTGPIPNRDEGWGMVDISKLDRPHDAPVPFYLHDGSSVFTDSGQVDQYSIMADRGDEPLKVSLVWTDKEASSGTGSGRALINDLNLEVISPSGEVYRGNAFSDGWTQANTDTMSDFDYSGVY